MNQVDITPFLKLRSYLTIAHHIPGRIRLRLNTALFPRAGHDFDKQAVDRVIGAIDGIKEVRLNLAAASVVISYAEDKIEPQWWDILVQGDEAEAGELLTSLLNTKLVPAVEAARGYDM